MNLKDFLLFSFFFWRERERGRVEVIFYDGKDGDEEEDSPKSRNAPAYLLFIAGPALVRCWVVYNVYLCLIWIWEEG